MIIVSDDCVTAWNFKWCTGVFLQSCFICFRSQENEHSVKVAAVSYCNNICIYYVYIYIYTNLPVNAIVRLPHPRSGDSQGQETF